MDALTCARTATITSREIAKPVEKNASIHIPAGIGIASAQLYLRVNKSYVFASLSINRKNFPQSLVVSAAYASDSYDGRLRAQVIGSDLVVGAHYTISPAALIKAVDWLRAHGVEVNAERMDRSVEAPHV